MRKILIVIEKDTLLPRLGANYDITICHCAEDAAALLQQKFDGMILDLFLPGKDGLTFLEQSQEYLPPVVLMVTRLISPYILQSANGLGVGHVIRIPFSESEVYNRLEDMFRKLESPFPDFSGSDARYHLKRLGISSGKGYHRILQILSDYVPDDDPCLFNDFYSGLAQKDSVTSAAIDNSIHRTIWLAYDSRDDAVWKLYFPDTSRCPKNKEFLSALAEVVKKRTPPVSPGGE